MAFDMSTARPVQKKGFDISSAKPVTEQKKEKGFLQKAGDFAMDYAVNPALEGMAAVNRGTTNLADFVMSPVNAAMQVAGSDMRVPSLTQALAPATQGNFMEQGLGRDVVRAAGETVPAALAMGGAMRAASQPLTGMVTGQVGNVGVLPQLATGSESVGAGALRQMGSSTAGQDAGYAALSGTGSVIGGEAGESVGGEEGRQVGSMIGSIVAPLAGAAATEIPGAISGRIARSQEAALIKEAAPTIDRLKNSAREVYKEIDDLGAVVDSGRINGLVRDLNSSIKNEGFNRRIHPKVSAALREISTNADKNLKVTDVDVLRKVARSAAASIEPDEARLGTMMVGKIDDFMDSLGPSDLVGGNAGNVGEKYRHARQLWQRAKKAEDVEFIFDKAKNQASGFENGLRTQFRSLLNNKKKIKSYTKEEIDAIQKVVRGGGVENAAKALGKFGFSEGQATSMLLGSLGVAGGAALGGGAGAVAVPLIGQVSKNLAQKLTRNNSEMVSQIVRSGRDATGITKAYFMSVPAKQRSPYELAELLLSSGAVGTININAKSEPLKKFISETGVLIGAAQSQGEDK